MAGVVLSGVKGGSSTFDRGRPKEERPIEIHTRQLIWLWFSFFFVFGFFVYFFFLLFVFVCLCFASELWTFTKPDRGNHWSESVKTKAARLEGDGAIP